jgi:predicted RNA-binding protein YlqC (UPF0109 family)
MEEELKTISVEEVVALVEYIAKNLVDEPDAVKVVVKNEAAPEENAEEKSEEASEEYSYDSESEDEKSDDEAHVTLELSVAKDDMGKVIGKQGRIAKAIRTVVRAATVKSGVKYRIDIL